jgi:Zn2+/Cd2+-exporting ATPase
MFKLWKNKELRFTVLCAVFLIAGFSIQYVFKLPITKALGFYILSYFFGAYFILVEAWKSIRKGKFEIDFLMLVAAAGAAILGEWAEGALLLFLFSLGHAMEHYAMSKAERSIAALSDLSARSALVWEDEGWIEMPVEQLKLGDRVLVKPNQKIPADGVLVKGEGPVNEAPITGESMPIDKFTLVDKFSPDLTFTAIDRKFRLFSGSITGNQVMEMIVMRAGNDTSLNRLIEHVKSARQRKSETQKNTDKMLRYYVPAVLVLVACLHFVFLVRDEAFSNSFYRAMAVLVSASPCALAISTPSAVLSAIARAAQMGVLIKGGKPLEQLYRCDILAFDKTGTITSGMPGVSEIFTANSVDQFAFISAVVSIEQKSDHPLAMAIVRDASALYKDQFEILDVPKLELIHGMGIQGLINGRQWSIGNLALMEKSGAAQMSDEVSAKYREMKTTGHTIMLVAISNEILGCIGLKDTIRPEAIESIKNLKTLGFNNLIMLSGDLQEVASNVAAEVGLTKAIGGLLPEEKVDAIRKLQSDGSKVGMIGDGVNDAPAMVESTVSVAMGAIGSDLAMETAEVVLMSDKLDKIPFIIGLSRKTHQIIKQNIFISMGMVAILMPLTMLDIATMGPAVLMHEGSTVVVVLNALRLLGYKGH